MLSPKGGATSGPSLDRPPSLEMSVGQALALSIQTYLPHDSRQQKGLHLGITKHVPSASLACLSGPSWQVHGHTPSPEQLYGPVRAG